MKIFIGALVTVALVGLLYWAFVMTFTPNLYDFLIVAAAIAAVVFGTRWFRKRNKSSEIMTTTE